jgi:hypothetical protein
MKTHYAWLMVFLLVLALSVQGQTEMLEVRWEKQALDIGPAGNAQALETADLDGDSDLDLVFATKEKGLQWWENRLPEPGMVHALSIFSGVPDSIAVADPDRDGDADILAVSGGMGLVWLENRLSDGEEFAVHSIDSRPAGSGPLYALDMDGDGDIEVFRVLPDGKALLWKPDGKQPEMGWERRILGIATADIQSLEIVDMDGNGRPDMVILDQAGELNWLTNPGGAGASPWTEHAVFPFVKVRQFAVGDFSGDGWPDIMASDANGSLFWLENPAGEALPFWNLRTVNPYVPDLLVMVSSDPDGDGDADLVTLSGGTGLMGWWENPGPTAGEWEFHPVEDGLLQGRFLRAADMDRDGDADLVGAGMAESALLWKNLSADEPFEAPAVVAPWKDTAIPAEKRAANKTPAFLLADPFVDIGAGMQGVMDGSVAWGDYDNDGDPDALLTGIDGSTRYAVVYRNDGGGAFASAATLPGINVGGGIWGDSDNDGDLDILLFGYNGSSRVTKLYRNTGGSFAEVTGTCLENVADSAAAFGDCDNDGDLDVVLAGQNTSGTLVTKVFGKNPGDSYTQVASLQGVRDPAVAWGDYDNDGDSDILLAGINGTTRYAIVYRNEGGGAFTDIGAGLTGVSNNPAAWGDFDNDGDLDILITGTSATGPVTKLYWNDGGVFAEVIGTGLAGIEHGGAAFGDMDNDGDLDIVLSGYTGSANWSRVYRNDGGGAFSDLGSFLPALRDSSVAWGDYDNDGRLDVLLSGDSGSGRISRVYHNEQTVTTNTVPSAPTNLNASGDGFTFNLSWDAASDGQTPAASLTYNLRVGTTPGGSDLYAGMADTGTGYRRVPAMGGSQLGASAIFKPGYGICTTAYWSVQAVDSAFAGGAFASEGNFALTGQFCDSGVGLTGISVGSAAWGDYDNDGDLDVLITGYTGSSRITRIYRNDGGGTFTENAAAGLIGVSNGEAAWGDYDRDGDLDVLLAGFTGSGVVTKVYRNNGDQTFTETAALTGFRYADVAWGDYDNDGDLDALVAGDDLNYPGTRLFRNEGGVFVDGGTAGLESVQDGSLSWGDYDNDGDLDVLMTGRYYDGSFHSIARVYRNNGSGAFTDIGAGLQAVAYSEAAWGDYDNDGDLDILLTGFTGTDRIARLYRNNGNGTFSNMGAAGLPGVADGSVAWGDTDNDGRLDILIAGNSGPSTLSGVYHNNGDGTFSAAANFTGVRDAAVAWGDYDNDGRLDVLLAGDTDSGRITKLFHSNSETSNTAPGTPAGLSASVNGNTMSLSWNAASDGQTPASGLTYNLRIGTTPGAQNVTAPMADVAGGFRRLPDMGNAQPGTTAVVKGLESCSTYYWSVQAVDGAYAGGGFSAEGIFYTSSPYCNSGAGLVGAMDGSVAWGDYDNDGDLDLVVMGIDGATRYSRVYRNDGGGAFTATADLTGLEAGTAVWGDYDRDGDLDLLQTGSTGATRMTRLYRNTGGAFSEVTGTGLADVGYAAAVFGDYDNDGDLDVALAGLTPTNWDMMSVYRKNSGDSYTEVASLNQIRDAALAWGDYDNDGDLDILQMGSSGGWARIYLYRNNGGGSFSEVGSPGLTEVTNGSATWGDVDNDGDLDLLICGTPWSGGPVTKLYRNTNGAFAEISGTGLPGIEHGQAVFGDMDNDGVLDVLLSGYTGSTRRTGVYHGNGGGTFSDVGAFLPALRDASVAWGDYDNDGKLDVLLSGDSGSGRISRVYHNEQTVTANTVPSAPTNLNASGDGFTFNLAWSPAADSQTPAAGLTYNLRVGTTPGGSDLYAVMADVTSGLRRIPEMGGSQLGTSSPFTPTVPGCYTAYWSVQAVDSAFAGGPFAAEGSLQVETIPFCRTITLIGADHAAAAWGDYDNDGDLDLIVTGDSSGTAATTLYRNDGGTFTSIPTALPGVTEGDAAWGDYDRDGDLDLGITGTTGSAALTRIYRNDGSGVFIQVADLQGVSRSSLAWGDYDNDGDLDVLITGINGATRYARVYRSDGGDVFASAANPMGGSGVELGGAIWGDTDNDGDLDILLFGFDGGTRVTKLYRNTSGSFAEVSGTGLENVADSAAAFADIDNDGDLDVVLAGQDPGGALVTKVFKKNSGDTYTQAASLQAVRDPAVAWGDYDNDGDADLLVTGVNGSTRYSIVYRNNGDSTFTSLGEGLTDVSNSAALWGDYDNDGRLDLLVAGTDGAAGQLILYRNTSPVSNAVPAAPAGLSAEFSGAHDATFAWSAPADDHTPAAALTYNLVVGTSPAVVDVVSPMADVSSGYRRIVAPGNAQQGISAEVKNLPGNCSFYWGVQTVDGAHGGGTFATGVVAWPTDPIYVDDDYTGSTPGWNCDHFASIQSGINAAINGGTVRVAAGTYVENVNLGKNATLELQAALTVQGDFTQSAGAVIAPPGALQITGNLSPAGGTFNANGGTVVFAGSGVQLFSGSATFFNITVGGSSTLRLSSGGVLAFAGDWSLMGSFDALTNSPNTVALVGTGAQTFPSGVTVFHLSIAATSTLSAPAASIYVAGNWDNAGGFTHNNGSVTFNGNGAQTITGTNTFCYLSIENTHASEKVDASGAGVTVVAVARVMDGILRGAPVCKSFQLYSAGTLDLSGDMTLSGDWSDTGGTFAHNGHTLTFNGAGVQTVSGLATFGHLSIAGGANVTLNNAISVAGNWTNAGQLTASGHGVTFTGSGTHLFSGLTAFANVTINSGDTLQMTQNSTLQLTGTLNLAGSLDTTTTIPNHVMFIGTGAQTVPSITYHHLWLNDGLLGYWKLDDASGMTAADSSGYGHSAALNNSPVWSTDLPATNFRDPGSLQFNRADADNAYITGTDSIGALQQITVAAWVKMATMPASVVERFVTVLNEKAVLRYDGAMGTGQLHFYMTIGGSIRSIRVNNVLAAGAWFHVAGTYDGTTMHLYLNGTEVGTPVTISGAVGTGDTIRFSSSGSNEALDGFLDEVRLYDRALTLTEIQALAAGNLPNTALGDYRLVGDTAVVGDLTLNSGNLMGEDLLTGHWKMNEGSGTATADASESGNTGTLENGAVWTADTAPITPPNPYAVAFDGTDDDVRIPHSTVFSTPHITVSAWIKADTWMTESWRGCVVGKDDWSGGSHGFNLRTGANGTLSFVVGTAGGWKDAVTAALMAAGTWTHIAGTYDGTTVRAYINGVERGTAVGGGDMLASSFDLLIGRAPNDGARRFDGIIDDVRIFSEALSPGEIQALADGAAASGPAQNHQLAIQGNFTRNGGTFSSGSTTVGFSGSVQQNISGPMTFHNVSITNASGVRLWSDAAVHGQLALTSGDLNTGTRKAVLGLPSTASGDYDIVGTSRRQHTFAIGTAYPFGSPFASLNFASGTPPTSIDVLLEKISPSGLSSAVQRQYTITPTGGSGYAATVRLHYRDSELGSASEGALKLFRYSSSWIDNSRTGIDVASNWVEKSGITTFSPWALSSSGTAPGGPAEASKTGSPMKASKGSGTSVNVTYTPASCATDHAIYWGQSPIAGALSWSGKECARGTSGSTSFNPLADPPAGSFYYFVIVGNNGTNEGSYGKDSSNGERQDALPAYECHPQQLVGSCP